MIRNFNKILTGSLALAAILAFGQPALAGNEDRAGQAGATELLINPWTRSSGWGGINVANVRGLESQFNNIAGLAFTHKTDVQFSYTDWLKGSDVKVYSFGIAQKVGESGAMAIGVMSMNMGDIEVTTTDQPEGG